MDGLVEGTHMSCSHPTRGSQVGTLGPAQRQGCAHERELLLHPGGQCDTPPPHGTPTHRGGSEGVVGPQGDGAVLSQAG